jgi:hypothetical protein
VYNDVGEGSTPIVDGVLRRVVVMAKEITQIEIGSDQECIAQTSYMGKIGITSATSVLGETNTI